MPQWLTETVAVTQLILNGAAIVGGAAIWKLYVDRLKATIVSKDATIETAERNRDFWKDKAVELEKRSPEVLEKSLAERIQVRDAEITAMKADQEFDKAALRTLEIAKGELEQDLFRTQGFRAMLALDDGDEKEPSALEEIGLNLLSAEAPKSIEVAYIGEVGADSGVLMVTDPSYIDHEWRREPFELIRESDPPTEDTVYSYSYRGVGKATLNGQGYGQLAYQMGHAGAGVAFQTGWGDGLYAVYAEKHDGRIVRVYVNVG